MKRVKLTKEPPTFDVRCRQRGRAWLKGNAKYERPKDYWSEFEPQLRMAFGDLCGYCAMFIMRGQVDHFVPVAILKARGQDDQVYEWSNFRYCEGVMNQRKANHLILDPFKLKDKWFEVQLPSLQLVLTAEVPKTRQTQAAFTIERLGLRDSEVVLRYRQQWFEMYCQRTLTIEALRQMAPLIASAVEQDLAKGTDWRK